MVYTSRWRISRWGSMGSASSWKWSSLTKECAGVTYPLTQRFATLTMGPGQDGAMSTLDFKNSGYEQLVKSKVLEVLAPEARFI